MRFTGLAAFQIETLHVLVVYRELGIDARNHRVVKEVMEAELFSACRAFWLLFQFHLALNPIDNAEEMEIVAALW